AFASDVPRRRSELKAALDGGDLEAAARLLHGLCGSASYLGASELHRLCGELERAANAGDMTALRAALPDLMQMLDRFEAESA
ncbi:Hpt domain-containing protein, partial [Massilia horti]